MSTAASTTPSKSSQVRSKSSAQWTAPEWARELYGRFPLVTHEQEDDLACERIAKGSPSAPSLWIHPPLSSRHPHSHSWASSSPSSLRIQLLFLLRDPPISVDFREWRNEQAVPGGTLPALYLPSENLLVPTDEIRGWLDKHHPMEGVGNDLNGMLNQAAHDQALAISQLILGRLYPAYLASLPKPHVDLHLRFPIPPPLAAGLTTPLPPTLTGDGKSLDTDDILTKGVEVLDALEVVLRDAKWTLGAPRPTPLDALLTSHLYVLYDVSRTEMLRSSLDERGGLGRYVGRVMDFANARIA